MHRGVLVALGGALVATGAIAIGCRVPRTSNEAPPSAGESAAVPAPEPSVARTATLLIRVRATESGMPLANVYACVETDEAWPTPPVVDDDGSWTRWTSATNADGYVEVAVRACIPLMLTFKNNRVPRVIPDTLAVSALTIGERRELEIALAIQQ